MPLQPERPAVQGFGRFWEVLRALANQLVLLGIVCSQLDERGKSHKEWLNAMTEAFQDDFLGKIHRAALVNEAADRRLTLREMSTSARAYREMLSLTKNIALEARIGD